MIKPTIIAIDGPSASGKSTIAEKLARELDYLYFDTGVMYRAVTLAGLQRLASLDDEDAVVRLSERIDIDISQPSVGDGRMYDVMVDGEDVTWAIRSAEVEANVSQVSAYPGVRTAMTEQQRRIGKRGNVIMAGRDIGTVVFPDAELKIYLVASPEERARRRHVENMGRGVTSDYSEILTAMIKRDQIDSTRTVAPLRPAEDAYIIDTDGLSIEEVLDKVKSLLAE
jgi:cytidylate kinase